MKWLSLLMLGVSVFMISFVYSKRIMEWLRYQSLGTRDYVVERLALMFIEVSPNKILMAQLIGSVGLGTLVFILMIPQWFPATLFAIMVTVLGWKLPKPIVDFMYQQRVDQFTNQMIDGLALMANGMKSGLSVVQAMGVVTQELPDPIKQEFTMVLNENKLGVSVEEAFINLSRRIVSDDVEMFVTSVNILKETGGNLAETFDTIVTTIRERIKIQNKIKSMTAAAFLQGMTVLAVPPVLGIMFYLQDPDYMKPMFETTVGWVLIFTVFLIEIVAFFVIMKLVKIEV
ncbi:MAG: type II secretion system F family protein [Xanthomonadaceae bacterium]|nr:type II secretion system F family protein [Xanthomonadaceae bacterium]